MCMMAVNFNHFIACEQRKEIFTINLITLGREKKTEERENKGTRTTNHLWYCSCVTPMPSVARTCPINLLSSIQCHLWFSIFIKSVTVLTEKCFTMLCYVSSKFISVRKCCVWKSEMCTLIFEHLWIIESNMKINEWKCACKLHTKYYNI